MSDSGYYATRYTPDPRRRAVWRHMPLPAALDQSDRRCARARRGLLRFLEHHLCRFAYRGRRRAQLRRVRRCRRRHRGRPVHRLVSRSPTRRSTSSSHRTCFEHLDRGDLLATLGEMRRVLRGGGRLILVQPNFRLRPHEYFDDYTHVAVFTDRSLPDMLDGQRVHRRACRGPVLAAHAEEPARFRSPFGTAVSAVAVATAGRSDAGDRHPTREIVQRVRTNGFDDGRDRSTSTISANRSATSTKVHDRA